MFTKHRIVSLFLVKLMILSTVGLLFVSVNAEAKKVYVKGYFRSDGTYVKPHYRTVPDGNPFNNYSFPGNYNRNKGTYTTGDSFKYLQRYYNRSKPKYNLGATYTPSPLSPPRVPSIAHDLMRVLEQSDNRTSNSNADMLMSLFLLRENQRRTPDTSQFYQLLFDEVKKAEAKNRQSHQREVAKLKQQIRIAEQKLKQVQIELKQQQQVKSRQRQIEFRKLYDKALSNGDYAKALDISYNIKGFDSRTRERLRSVISFRQKHGTN